MSLLRLLWAVLLLPCLAATAFSQQVEDYATVTARPDWVVPAELDLSPFEMEGTESEQLLLFDWQVLFRDGQRFLFHHRAMRPNTIDAATDQAAVQIAFDPAYSRVELHSLKVHRGDEVRDLLDLDAMDIYRFETDRDRLIYNGNLELSHLLPDIRVGDVIEYSYSVVGNNPALGSNFRGYAQHQYGVPVRFLRNRFTFPEGTDVYVKSLTGAPEPERLVVAEGKVYDWTHRNVTGIDYESGQPAGAFVYPTSLLTSYASWSEVGQHFTQFYDTTGEKPAALIEIANEIMAAHQGQPARARAALSWVQSQVRYLGIELGEGGYIPRGPDLVLERRFGDCKDMVLLLNTILEVMGIAASPVLVHSEWRRDVDLWGPTHAAFDHVISMVSIGGRNYFLDPTRGEQLGDLDNVGITDFGKGVVIGEDSAGMIDIKVAGPEFLNVFEDYYAPADVWPDMSLRNVSTYFGSEADRMLGLVNDDGVEALEERFLQYYRGYYEDIEQTAPMIVDVWDEDAMLVLTSQYIIKNAWADSEDGDGTIEFSVSSGDLLSLVPDLPDGPRETAFAIDHPTRVKHSYEIVLDDSWDLEDDFTSRRLASFDFRSMETFHRGVLRNETTFYTRSDRIEPEEFEAAQDALEDLQLVAGARLWQEPESWPYLDADMLEAAFVGYALIGILVTLFVVYRRRNIDLEWRKQQIYYPVSVFKFVLLNVATVGLYQMFWSYKNWLWVKEAEGVKLMPIPRAFFVVFTNFWLFTRIATHEPMPGKLLHFFAIPLALVILLLSALPDDWDPGWGASDLTVLVPLVVTVLYLPLVYRIKWLNRSNGKHMVMNSQFSWPAIALIAFGGPVSLMIYFSWAY